MTHIHIHGNPMLFLGGNKSYSIFNGFLPLLQNTTTMYAMHMMLGPLHEIPPSFHLRFRQHLYFSFLILPFTLHLHIY